MPDMVLFIHLSKEIVALDLSKPVYCQCYITETPREDRFAKDADDSEDAARVLVIRGMTLDGKIFDGPAQAGEEKTIRKVNSV
jgi:hypothetical protein